VLIVWITVTVAATLRELVVRFVAGFNIIAVITLLSDDFLDASLRQECRIICDGELLGFLVPCGALDALHFLEWSLDVLLTLATVSINGKR